VGQPAAQLEPRQPGKRPSPSKWPATDPKICDEIARRSHGRCPATERFDWSSTSPPHIRKGAEGRLFEELCPSLEPASNWTIGARSNLNGRAREPMSFWGTEQKERSDQDPR
jgi:hypothetical protein